MLSGCVRDMQASPLRLIMAACCCRLNFGNGIKDSAPYCRFTGEFCFVLYLGCYGLDEPGFDSWHEQDIFFFFHFHVRLKSALRTTKSSIQWVLGLLYFGGKTTGVVNLVTLVPRLEINGSVLLLGLYASMACTQVPNLIGINLVVLEREGEGGSVGERKWERESEREREGVRERER